MPGHGGRCVKITCNFTHPSAQSNRNFPSKSYTYKYEADNQTVRNAIEKHCKRKYAYEYRIKHWWIGYIQTNDRIRNQANADSDLNENVPQVL
jgi:hypothetical protein